MLARNQLRHAMREQRRGLRPGQRRRLASAMARRLRASGLLLSRHRIALYFAADGEMDPSPLMTGAIARRHRLFLPVLRPRPARSLLFLQHRRGEPLKPNRFDIPEPVVGSHRPTPPWALDAILMPLVAFDRHGNRLGMGGGFYDRSLAQLESGPWWRRPLLIGLAYEFQKVDRLRQQPWDVPLDAVATENAVYSWSIRSSRREAAAGGGR